MFSFFKNQLIEIIEWKEQDNDTVLWKFIDEKNDSNIKYGAQLIVRESQVALFLNEGQIADVFLPGRHTLKTENMPILTSLKSWKYGFESPFKCDIYFISTRQFTDLKWGTPNPIFIKDPEAGRIQLRAFGSYFIRVKDAKLFFREYAGTKETLNIEELGDTFRGLVVPKFAEALAQSGVTAFDIYANYSSLGDKIQPMLQKDCDPFGIEITKFQITSASLPPDVEQHLNEISKANLTNDQNMNKMMQFSQMRSMEKSAEKGNYENFQMGQMNMLNQQMMMQMMQNQMQNNNNKNNNDNSKDNDAPKESREEIMKALKDLGELKQMGILSEVEFEAKKKELLAKL